MSAPTSVVFDFSHFNPGFAIPPCKNPMVPLYAVCEP